MSKKNWSRQDIYNLNIMIKEKVPIKILAKYFEVSNNAVSKALQRYCRGYSNQTYKEIIRDKREGYKRNENHILRWMLCHEDLFIPIINRNISPSYKTMLVNKILYKNNFKILSHLEVNNNLVIIANKNRKI